MTCEDWSQATWRTSSLSHANNANCVEVAPLPLAVAVRDTRDRDGGTLVVDRDAWAAFVAGIADER